MKKGFTLVELLVVVAILGILAAIGIVSYNEYVSKTKENATKTIFNQIVKYIDTELMKCNLGMEIEAYEKYKTGNYPNTQNIGCNNHHDDYSYNNSLDKFDKITGNIISYIHSYGGSEKGFNNPYGNDTNIVKGSAIIINSTCPSEELVGWFSCNTIIGSGNNGGKLYCCARLPNNQSVRKVFENVYE